MRRPQTPVVHSWVRDIIHVTPVGLFVVVVLSALVGGLAWPLAALLPATGILTGMSILRAGRNMGDGSKTGTRVQSSYGHIDCLHEDRGNSG